MPLHSKRGALSHRVPHTHTHTHPPLPTFRRWGERCSQDLAWRRERRVCLPQPKPLSDLLSCVRHSGTGPLVKLRLV